MTDTILERAKISIANAKNLKELDAVRVAFLGKKGELTALLKQLGTLEKSKRPDAGKRINDLKNIIHQILEERKINLEAQSFQHRLENEKLDVTLPGRNIQNGGLHPIGKTLERIQNLFSKQGFTIETGPEIEDDFHNFSALNIPPDHPARTMHDTFYFDRRHMLRTHTSTVQIRALEKRRPPLRLIAPGKVYRRDSDMTHTPMFHQVEGLVVDETVNFAMLKGLLGDFLRAFFEDEKLAVRFRPSYFPFTEPSAEVDIGCFMCERSGCRVCKKSGWLEVLGAGLVHPNVFRALDVDSQKYSGLAFGMGVERLAMLRYRIDDLRLFFENDLRFLRQF